MTRLVLVRGLPGSGKTTFAKSISKAVFSADDLFERSGKYKFDPTRLAEAHNDCQSRVVQALQLARDNPEQSTIVVANTFVQRWEIQPYLNFASDFKCEVFVIDLFDGGLSDEQLEKRNQHGVPVQTISAMRNRYEHDWRSGNTIPPWERGCQ